MTTSGYLVPAGQAVSELHFSNSRFVGIVGGTDSVDQARSFVSEVRDCYPDASHWVYAFVVGSGNTITQGMSDDGEPSGTAGRPVLSVLEGAGLGDVAVVVVRYFGGKKLGTGGLVRAYTATAQAALEKVERGRKVERVAAVMNVSYALFEVCKKAALDREGIVEGELFNTDVQVHLALPRERADEIMRTVSDLSAGKVRWSS